MISLDAIQYIKDKSGWKILYNILEKVEKKNNINFTRNVLKQVLLEIHKILKGS